MFVLGLCGGEGGRGHSGEKQSVLDHAYLVVALLVTPSVCPLSSFNIF